MPPELQVGYLAPGLLFWSPEMNLKDLIRRGAAALILLAASTWETLHALRGAPWTGMSPRANHVAWVLVPLWSLAAILLLIPRRLRWRNPLTLVAILACFLHGVVLRIGESTAGTYGDEWIYLGGGIALVLLLAPSLRAQLTSEAGLKRDDSGDIRAA